VIRIKRIDRRNKHQLCKPKKPQAAAIVLADDVRLLVDWMGKNILSLAGPSLPERQKLYDFVVEQFPARENRCRVGSVLSARSLRITVTIYWFCWHLQYGDKYIELAERVSVIWTPSAGAQTIPTSPRP
jgi:hypothetical protein